MKEFKQLIRTGQGKNKMIKRLGLQKQSDGRPGEGSAI